MLLDLQYRKRGSTPFAKNLKSLKMHEADIKGLLPKVINKLMEYESYDVGKQELAKEIAKELLAQESFGLSSDEINFYFAAGMALAREVGEIVYEKEQTDESAINA